MSGKPLVMSSEESRAWEAWKRDHPDSQEAKTWFELPYWVQLAYLAYMEATCD